MSPEQLPAARPLSAGEIHDIGYRHYAGPRLSAAAVARALFLESLRGSYGLGRAARSKIMPMMLFVIACLPALIIAVVANVNQEHELPVRYASYPHVLGLVIVLFVGSQAPASVSRDLRFRVVSLYFSRPLRRSEYVQAKYGALVCAVFVLTAVPLLVLYAGAVLAKMPFWTQTRGLLEGLATAALLSVLLAGIGLVIAAVTPRRGIGVAAVIAVLVVDGAVQAALQGLGVDQGNEALAQYSRLLAPFSLVDAVLSWTVNQRVDETLARPSAAQGLAAVAVVLAASAACYWLLLVRYRRVSVS